jgi:Tfp pilus assembly protein PilE
MTRALVFLRKAIQSGLTPAWAVATGALAVAGGTVVTFVESDPLWIVVAVFAVLLLGAYRAWEEADRRTAIAEPKAARAELLEKSNAELSKMYAVSQAQSKVLEDWQRNPPTGAR